jgi:polar amino acid transport system substrate-binding protein
MLKPWGFLIGFWLMISSTWLHSEVVQFAVSEGEPPLSSSYKNKAHGLLPDLIQLVLDYIPAFEAETQAFPWPRAQYFVEHGELDGLLTYPSDKRKKYAVFGDFPIYRMDFGYLIYRKNNPNRTQIEAARRFEDLASLTIVTQTGAEWEADNIPKFLKRREVNDLEGMIKLVFGREEGDYFIMPPEQAVYLAKKFGYQNDVAYTPVRFIPDSLIPFHIGIRKDHPKAYQIIQAVNQLKEDPQFQKDRQAIIDRYRD